MNFKNCCENRSCCENLNSCKETIRTWDTDVGYSPRLLVFFFETQCYTCAVSRENAENEKTNTIIILMRKRKTEKRIDTLG